jgi:hypothetical protein
VARVLHRGHRNRSKLTGPAVTAPASGTSFAPNVGLWGAVP